MVKIEMKRDRCIFVSIASYRDDLCGNTIKDCFLKAKKPSRVFVGICQQNSIDDNDCIYDNNDVNDNDFYHKYKNNIRIIRIPFYEARGPVYARYLCSSLLDKKNEEFYFQIDSHTIFIKNWDTILIAMIDEIKEKKLSSNPVISYYPKDFSAIDENSDNQVPVIENLIFDDNTKVFKLAQAIYTNVDGNYIKTHFCSAGMFFCSSSFIDVMPFDPTLNHLFIGEEILNSIKFFTNGYDIFTPKMNVIYHEYLRDNKPKFWNEPLIAFDDRRALEKVRYYLFNYNPNNKNPYYYNYKLGTVRTIDDYYKAIGIDINNFDYKKKNKKIIVMVIIIVLFLIFVLIGVWMATPRLQYP